MEKDGKISPKYPIPGKRNILITSALPYCKRVPHLGDIIGCVLSADVYARYCRLRGYNAIYICETAEFKTAKHVAIHKEVYDWFDISFDKFGLEITLSSEHTGLWDFFYMLDEYNPRCNVSYAPLLHGHHAPICYTSVLEKWWKSPENVEFHQFLGKDNLPPHTVFGTGGNWTMTKTLTGHLNYEKGKFSKSSGVGVFGNDAKDTNIPVEVWRYYLLTNRPEEFDTSFKWGDLQEKLKGELVSNLGNFVNRVLSVIAKPENAGYGSVIPDAPGAESHLLTKSLGQKVGGLVEEYVKAMEKIKLKQALKTAMLISCLGNTYLDENELWELYEKDKPSCALVIRSAAGLIHLLARLLEPFMPSFSREVFKQLNLPPQFSLWDERGEVLQASRPWEILPRSHRIGTPQPLFKELKDEEVQQYKEKFNGSQPARCCTDAPSRARARKRAARRLELAEEKLMKELSIQYDRDQRALDEIIFY